MKPSKLIYALCIPAVMAVSCKKSFLDRPALDGTTLSNYYNTASEVRGLTATLYGIPWSGYDNRAMDCIGDVMAGNSYTGDGNADDAPFKNLTLTSGSARLAEAWKVFYKIGGWSSEYIKALEQKKASGTSASFIDPAIAECHFIRATVYFYITRIWGHVPIVTDPAGVALSGNFKIPRYLKGDVLKFVIEELKIAEKDLPESDVPGRLTKYAAKAMMAKVYLYMKDYDNARVKAKEVIDSKKYTLLDNYGSLFNSSANNNSTESIFAIQKKLATNPWGTGSQKQPDRGPGNLQTTEASMWELYAPTIDMRDAYESGDLRKSGSIMTHGWSHPAWKPKTGTADYDNFMANGYKYDTLQPAGGAGGQKNDTRSNIAKYVVGPGASYGGEPVLGMNTGINTMLLRYSDVLLIYAEAILAGAASTSNGDALAAFNEVRERAGLQPKSAITNDDILHERRVEFAFEGDYWFDIKRQGYVKAKALIQAQNRGTMEFSKYITPAYAKDDDMDLPVPATEALANPALLEAPVPYY